MYSKRNDPRMKTILRAMNFSIEKLYSYGRYKILDKEILRSIEQYFPPSGKVLDIGCGFGLFSSYYALGNDRLSFWGFDRNKNRIKFARQLAENLELTNASFDVHNAIDISIDQKYTCIYMLDIIHHLPKEFVPEFIQSLVNVLEDGGRLIIKDVDTFPYPKMVFTWLLDKIMSPQDKVHYWPSMEFIDLLESNHLTVYRHSINDILPYSHVLYICHKK